MIKNIVFDIGNVLVDYRWQECIAELGLSRELEEKLAEATVKSDRWAKQDKFPYEEEELVQLFLPGREELEEGIRAFIANLGHIAKERSYAVPFIRSLKKKGFHVYALSNYGKAAFERCSENFAFLKELDGIVVSYQEGFIKPEPELYKCLLNRYGIKAGESVFIDDLEDNLTAARNLKFQVLHCVDGEKMQEDLIKILTKQEVFE